MNFPRPSTYGVRIDLGGGYSLYTMTTAHDFRTPGQPWVMSVLIDSNNANTDLVSIAGNSIDEATTNAREFLKSQRGLLRLLDEIDGMEK